MVMVMEVTKKKLSSAPTWKRRKRKIKWAQGKGIFNTAILFCHSRHQVDVSGFRIDNRTIKRGNL